MDYGGLFSGLLLYAAGTFLCVLPALLAAASGQGPWMISAIVTSIISVLVFFYFAQSMAMFGFNSALLGPNVLLTCLGLILAWASIREKRRSSGESSVAE